MAKYKLKTKKNKSSASEFLAGVEDTQKRKDSEKIVKLMQELTGQKPAMWGKSIVGFGSYHYKYASGQEGDWMAVGFSPRKQNLTFYFSCVDIKKYEHLLKKLGKYSTGKSCLYIKRLGDINLNALEDLIKESYRYAMTELDRS